MRLPVCVPVLVVFLNCTSHHRLINYKCHDYDNTQTDVASGINPTSIALILLTTLHVVVLLGLSKYVLSSVIELDLPLNIICLAYVSSCASGIALQYNHVT